TCSDRRASSDDGIALPVARHFAFFGTCGRVDDLEFFARGAVVALVGHHADRRARRALLGLVHEQLQLLFFTFPKLALRTELLAGIPLVFAGVGEDRELTFDRRRAPSQEYRDNYCDQRRTAHGPDLWKA